MTGQRSAFNSATRAMHQTILRSCEDKAKVEFIEVAGVANLLQEKVAPSLFLVRLFVTPTNRVTNSSQPSAIGLGLYM